MHEVAIIAAARTPFTGRSRGLASYRVDQLAGHALRHVAEEAATCPDTVMLGNCTGPGGNLGRNAALAAGFGTGCVGWGIDAQCGSGMVAVMQGAQHVLGTGEVVAAGGAESASTAPVRSNGGEPFARAPFAPEGFADPDMIDAADHLARVKGVSRRRQDLYAVRSHALAVESEGRVGDELARFHDPATGEEILDDGPRRMTAETVARFHPVRKGEDATVTPATAARISDGAAAVILRPESEASGPRWIIRASTLTGGDPALPGILPVAAIHRVMDQAGVFLGSVAAVEIVEAFAAQSLAVLDELGLTDGENIDPRVNAWGGALALGHPWGASGAAAVVRLAHRLRSEGPGSVGVAACAIGGGMGSALMMEYTE